ncbi:uncharacterized protein At1g26090, chloroplastic-like isoform X2 [Salvia splendens]|uniref:uncharacterized protein At1g26090, chloroplastic-like isoform X2 n=1 Tax=Salvia splendens TaxID=180675 RepID=UPI001C27A3F7|nr:uncharacterized protein At1g26090, chloroplastic-like isoform X2 [Salvia splendens]
MASCPSPLLPRSLFPPQDFRYFSPVRTTQIRRVSKKPEKGHPMILAVAASNAEVQPPKLVTFLGKGGSGKTTAAVFAAQHYATLGLKTCLVIQSQDPTAEYLLTCKIGSSSPVQCNSNLSAVRLETTKMILEPLKKLKQADQQLKMTQGILEGVVGEELGVLPGMDSIFSSLELERLLGFFLSQRKGGKAKYDVVVYDGVNTEETVRMISATSKARLYLKYMRMLAEKTDMGRVAGPSLLRLVDDALSLSGNAVNRTSSEMWDYLEQTLEKGSSIFAEPRRFGCYLVLNPDNPLSLNLALRYWGCVIQAGAQISVAFGIPTQNSPTASAEAVKNSFAPLPYALIPHLKFSNPLHWDEIIVSDCSTYARELLSDTTNEILSSVTFDMSNKSVNLFMPGFDKSEIKLYQYRGGTELLVEAGDQRRAIRLPRQIQGKVGGAKFVDRRLVITMR